MNRRRDRDNESLAPAKSILLTCQEMSDLAGFNLSGRNPVPKTQPSNVIRYMKLLRVDQADMEMFAAASADRNPLHLSATYLPPSGPSKDWRIRSRRRPTGPDFSWPVPPGSIPTRRTSRAPGSEPRPSRMSLPPSWRASSWSRAITNFSSWRISGSGRVPPTNGQVSREKGPRTQQRSSLIKLSPPSRFWQLVPLCAANLASRGEASAVW